MSVTACAAHRLTTGVPLTDAPSVSIGSRLYRHSARHAHAPCPVSLHSTCSALRQGAAIHAVGQAGINPLHKGSHACDNGADADCR